MTEHTKRLIDLLAGTTTAIAAMTLTEIQAALNIAVAVCALGWYFIRFYDYIKNKKIKD
jgi:hypothetical protein